jgi:hypothetical protein
MTATPAMDGNYVPKECLMITVHGPALDEQQQQAKATPAIAAAVMGAACIWLAALEKWKR